MPSGTPDKSSSTGKGKRFEHFRWWHTFVIPVMFPIMLISLVCIFLIIALITPPVLIAAMYKEFRLRQRYARKKQTLDWSDAAQRLTRGDGVLLVTWTPKGPSHVWWTPEISPTQADEIPLMTAQFLEEDFPAHYAQIYNEPTTSWCNANLRRILSNAYLTKYPRREFLHIAKDLPQSAIRLVADVGVHKALT